jgi:hypothetical protein
MTLTPPSLPAGYHWDIGYRFGADIVQGITRQVITERKLEIQTAEELHERCTLAAKLLDQLIETRDAVLAAELPEGWSAELDPDATHTALLKHKYGEADVRVGFARGLDDGVYPSVIFPAVEAVARCVSACEHASEAIAYRKAALAG